MMSATIAQSSRRDDPICAETWHLSVLGVLSALNIRTWGDFERVSAADLLSAKGFGASHLRDLQHRLDGAGVRLADAFHGPVVPERVEPILGVYFILCGEYVKIGYATNIKARFRDIQLANPHRCELIGYQRTDTVDEARRLEKALHGKLADHRHRGEWFSCFKGIAEVR